MLSFSAYYYYYYYHTSLLQSLDKTLIFWGIVRCMSWSVKNLSLVSRWRASWHSFFLLVSRSLMLTNKVPSPILTLPAISALSEQKNIRTYIHELHDFLQNYARHKRHQALQKLWSNAQNDKPGACALLFTHYIMSYFPAFLVCVCLSSPASSIWIPPHQNKKQQQHLLNKHVNCLIKFLGLISPITNTHTFFLWFFQAF